MNRVICIKGHFYDGDKYEACPHCAAGTEAIRQDSFSIRHSELEEERKKGRKNEKKAMRSKGSFFHRGEKDEKEVAPRQEAAFKPGSGTSAQTLLLQGETGAEASQQRSEQQQGTEQKAAAVETGQGAVREETTSRSLSAAFAASAQTPDEQADEGKTVGYFSTGRTEPPVGYLICIAGEDYGMGFPLKTGNNSIGRSVSMDVVVMDEKVSREKQAFVMYEPRRREFYMKPGEGTGLCYLNGEIVLEPVRIKAFDLILLGDTKLMLIPVCCEQFSWEEAE